MAMPIDLELKRAFAELQVKMVETSKKIQVIDNQIGVVKRVLQHAEASQRKIDTLPPGTSTYDSVGRMFLYVDLETMQKNLAMKTNFLTTRSSDLERNKEYLEKNLKESEDNIREMVQLRKEQGEVKAN